MLNRIFIIVGLLAIAVLAIAFIAPRFIHWGDYRDRMEALASGVLGADVAIRGDIDFTLLPQPRLHFSDIIVGDAASPAASVAEVEAEFALMDFLRDNYSVTSLVLRDPHVDLSVDENGLFGSGVDISASGGGVALRQARVENGALRLTDKRTGEAFSATGIVGDLRLASFAGPFQFQGAADYDNARYEVRFNSGAADAEGATRVSSYLRETGGAFSWTAEGALTAGAAPRFDGTMVYRQAPPPADRADEIRGDLVFESSLAASTDRVVLSGFTMQPDENRAGVRLTGSANIQLGTRREFDAVISGGVFSLPPRDATEVPAELPYEFVRLLTELPAPPVTPMPGRVEIELAEMGLRGFSLRNLQLVANTDGAAWQLEQAVATMPGETRLRLSGLVSNDDGQVEFRGNLDVTSARLDALAQAWRRSREDNPLFNMPGGLKGQVLLAGGALGIQDGQFSLGGAVHNLELRLGYAEEPRLDVVAQFDMLDPGDTAALMALLPEIATGGNFGVTFPDGSFSIKARGVDLLGLNAADFLAEGQWQPNSVRMSRLVTSDWGGVALDAGIRVGGTLAEPEFSGSGRISVGASDAAGLGVIYELSGTPYLWQQALEHSFPADLQFGLTREEADPAQVLTLNGALRDAQFDLRAEMPAGLAGLATSDLRLVASLEADSATDLAEQLGLGAVPLLSGDGPALASLFVEGAVNDAFEGRLALSQGNDSLSYFGRLRLAAAGSLAGEGTVDVMLGDASGLMQLAGASGGSLGAIEASAALQFDGLRQIDVTDISGLAGETYFGGAIGMQRVGQLPTFSGDLTLDTLDAEALAGAVFGASALIGADEQVWPEGPLAANAAPRSSRGDIAIRADRLHLAGQERAGATAFTYSWNPNSVGLSRFSTAIGGGSLALDLTQCCAGSLADRTVSGRLSLSDVDIASLTSDAVSTTLAGRIEGGMQFEGTGESLANAMRSMTGEGNFAIADFAISGLSPEVYPAVAGLDDVLNTDRDALETLISLALTQGKFTASDARGAFAIAGGTARLGNLIIEGVGARLAGSLNLVLENLGLNGSFVMTPLNFTDPSGLVETDTARIIASIGGTLPAPSVQFDLADIVAAIQVRANELEVDRLEALRAEDEARQRAAAEERNRLIEEQRRRAAEEEAARLAAEAEAQRLEQERLLLEQQQAAQQVQPPAQPQTPLPGPLDLTLPQTQQRNVPIGNGVNQPIELFPN